MSDSLNLNEITSQIQSYVRQLRNKRKTSQTFDLGNSQNQMTYFLQLNDVRSNIHSLAGQNKFNIQQMLELSSDMTSIGHVRAAYEYLTNVDEKHKVMIDFLHKNNRHYDVNV